MSRSAEGSWSLRGAFCFFPPRALMEAAPIRRSWVGRFRKHGWAGPDAGATARWATPSSPRVAGRRGSPPWTRAPAGNRTGRRPAGSAPNRCCWRRFDETRLLPTSEGYPVAYSIPGQRPSVLRAPPGAGPEVSGRSGAVKCGRPLKPGAELVLRRWLDSGPSHPRRRTARHRWFSTGRRHRPFDISVPR